jgi:4-amino-4-deoxy-L-arabinose transferase-like glycosyltransferase
MLASRSAAWPAWTALALPLIVLLALALRAPLWLANHPLHHDEALYGAWARAISSGRDPLLLAAWVDKPPLVLYVEAAALRLFGPSELALRLPGMLASLLAVPALYGLARAAYGPAAARLAALLLAASAFAIQFSPTAFTDPWLVLFLLLAAWAAVAGRAVWAGIAVGLAVASKQQGLLVAPLALALLAWRDAQMAGGFKAGRFVRRGFIPGAAGFLLIFLPVTYWDSLRWAKRPSFWDRSLATYGGLHLAAPGAWPSRAAAWTQQLGYLFGSPVITAALLALAALSVTGGASNMTLLTQGRKARHAFRDKGLASLRQDINPLTALLVAYVVGFFVLHIVFTFQPWDRYLLPMAPLTALLAARTLTGIRGGQGRVVYLVLAGALAWGATLGAAGRLPVGSDHGAYAGARALAAELRALPDESLVYYRSWGWHYGYYLFDAPQERRWWSTAWKLADDAATTARTPKKQPQWVVLPPTDLSAAEEIRTALRTRGLALGVPRVLSLGDAPDAWLFPVVHP